VRESDQLPSPKELLELRKAFALPRERAGIRENSCMVKVDDTGCPTSVRERRTLAVSNELTDPAAPSSATTAGGRKQHLSEELLVHYCATTHSERRTEHPRDASRFLRGRAASTIPAASSCTARSAAAIQSTQQSLGGKRRHQSSPASLLARSRPPTRTSRSVRPSCSPAAPCTAPTPAEALKDLPRAGQRQLVASGHSLDDNVVALHSLVDHSINRALDQRGDDGVVPSVRQQQRQATNDELQRRKEEEDEQS